MPTYTYTCTSCNDVVEKRQSFSDAPLTTCEQCGGSLRKVFHPVGIVFKGSGWYITDSRSSSNGTTTRAKDGKEAQDGKESKTGDASAAASSSSTSNGSATSTSSSTASSTKTPTTSTASSD